MKANSVIALLGLSLVSSIASAGSNACKTDKKDASDRPWEKLGWRAEIGAVADPDHFIEVRKTPDGLVFFETTGNGIATHACDDLMASTKMTGTDCSYLMQRGVAFPPKEILDSGNGFKRALLTYLKLITGSAVIGVSNASLAFISAGATSVSQIISPDPWGTFHAQAKLSKGMKEVGKCAILSDVRHDNEIVTRVEPGVYDNGQAAGMRWDMKNILSGIYSKNEDKSEGLDDNNRLHDLVNGYYAQSKLPVPATATTTDSKEKGTAVDPASQPPVAATVVTGSTNSAP